MPVQTTLLSNRRFRVTWKVNGETTYILENVNLEQAYENGVPPEATRPDPHNRWHVMMKVALRERASYLLGGETVKFCYQEPAREPGYDVEEIFLEAV